MSLADHTVEDPGEDNPVVFSEEEKDETGSPDRVIWNGADGLNPDFDRKEVADNE